MPTTPETDAPSGSAALPASIPDHCLIRPIGRGAYGEVWLAQSATGAWRAVKVIHRRLFGSDRPYEREFRGLQAFEPVSRQHESQLDILHVGRHDAGGYFYYVMELADSAVESVPFDAAGYEPRTLRTELNRRGRLPLSECVALGLQLTRGLEFLHGKGLVHRDVKPSNILFVGGIPKLADVGLVAPVEATRSLVGTLGYLPPEGPGTAQADLFGLGKVLYEACTGKDRQHFPEPATRIGAEEDYAALAEFNEIILKACAPDPRARYRSATRLHAELQLLEGGKSVRRVRRLERHLRLALRAAGLVLGLALLATLGYLSERRQARELDASARENLRRAIQLNVEQGVNRMEAGELPLALPWFVESLRLAEPVLGPDRVHRSRITAVLQQCPRLLALGSQPGPIHAATLTPDGGCLAVGGREGTVQVEYPGHATRPALALPHPAPVRNLAFSPDRRLLATACDDGAVRIWDLAGGAVMHPPGFLDGPVIRVEFSPDGQRLAAGSTSGDFRLWEVRSGKPLGPPRHHPVRLTDLALAPDGQCLATAGADGTARVWPLDDSAEPSRVIHHRLTVNRVAFTRDSRWVLTASDDGTAGVWAADTGAPRFPPLQHRDLVFDIQESPEGDRLLTAGGEPGGMGEVLLWEVASGRLVASLPRYPRPVLHARFSPGGRTVLAASVEGDVRVWDSRTGDPVTPVLRHRLPVTAAQFAADGRRFLTAGKDGVWKLWDLACEESTVRRFRTPSMVTTVRFDPRHSRVLAATTLHGVAILDAEAREISSALARGVELGLVMALAPDGTRFALADALGNTHLYDAVHGTPLQTLEGHGPDSRCLRFSPDGQWLASGGGDARVLVWRVDNGTPVLPALQHDATVLALDFSPDGRWLATGSGPTRGLGPGEARVWEIASGRLLLNLTHPACVAVVRFSPDGRRLLTACSDSEDTPCAAQLWDLPTGRPSGPPLAHGDGISDAAFSPDGHWIVTAGEDASLRLWEAATGRAVGRPMLHRRGVRCVRLSPDGRLILSGSGDGTARLWDALDGMPMAPPIPCAGFVRSLDFGADAAHVALGSGRWPKEGTQRLSGEVTLVHLPPNSWTVEDLELLARSLSGHSVDPSGGEVALEGIALERAFDTLRQRHPEFCTVPAADAVEWHRQETEASLAEHNLPAARLHLNFWSRFAPTDPRLARFLQEARPLRDASTADQAPGDPGAASDPPGASAPASAPRGRTNHAQSASDGAVSSVHWPPTSSNATSH